MAYNAVPTITVGGMLDESWWNTYIRDNFTAYASHDHGSSNDGALTLGASGGLTSARFTDGSDISAPGVGKTLIYTKSGKAYQRAGASGGVEQFAIVGHAWDET